MVDPVQKRLTSEGKKEDQDEQFMIKILDKFSEVLSVIALS